MMCLELVIMFFFFFFNDTATTEIYTLSLHDALPICRNIAARENVFRDPGIGDPRALRAADRMQHHHAVLGEHLRAASEEPVVEADPDMLEHDDRDHPVEFFRDVAIVLQAELDGTAELLLARPDTRERELLLRQGDAGNPRPGEFGEVKCKPAPAATDVEHAGPRLDPQLGGEVTFFGELGVVEGGRGGIEIGAAVLPVGIEKE